MATVPNNFLTNWGRQLQRTSHAIYYRAKISKFPISICVESKLSIFGIWLMERPHFNPCFFNHLSVRLLKYRSGNCTSLELFSDGWRCILHLNPWMSYVFRGGWENLTGECTQEWFLGRKLSKHIQALNFSDKQAMLCYVQKIVYLLHWIFNYISITTGEYFIFVPLFQMYKKFNYYI